MHNKLDIQIALEQTYSKNQLIPRVMEYFLQAKDSLEPILKIHNVKLDFAIDFMAQMAIRKRANLPTLVGLLRHHHSLAQDVVEDLVKCVKMGLVSFNTDLDIFIVKAELPKDIQHEIDKFQYPLPFVVKPKYVRTNKDTGFYTESGSIILRKNHHNEDVCLDHINKVNSMELAINMDVVNMIQNKWRNLDKRKQGETHEEFMARKKAFEKYDTVTREVIDLINKVTNYFYLTHKYDKRGRVYACGYHVNYMGNDWSKAIVEFADKEYIDD